MRSKPPVAFLFYFLTLFSYEKIYATGPINNSNSFEFYNTNNTLFSLNFSDENILRKYEIEVCPDNIVEKRCSVASFQTTYRFIEGSLREIDDFSGKHRLDYDCKGNLTKIIYSNGMRCLLAYDADDRIISVEYLDIKEALLCSFSYCYDTHDHLIHTQRVVNNNFFETTYSYDIDGRLIEIDTCNALQEHFSYTKEGEHAPLSPIIREYDVQGRLIRKITSANAYVYSYDDANRLISVITPQSTIAYAYNALGVRFQRIIDGHKEFYVYDDLAAVPTLIAAGEYIDDSPAYAVAITNSGFPLAVTINDEIFYPIFDKPNGHTIGYVDSKGNMHEVKLSAFGERVEKNDIIPIGFCHREHDAEAGLIYFQYRWYDPQIAQFLTPDPLKITPPASYAFCDYDPINYLDLLGLDKMKVCAYPPHRGLGYSLGGHAYLIITDKNGIEYTLGFYPEEPQRVWNKGRVIQNYDPDPKDKTDALALEYDLPNGSYEKISQVFGNKNYSLIDYNCVDACLEIIRQFADPIFPDCKASGISSPGKLMEEIHKRTGKSNSFIEKIQHNKNCYENWQNTECDPICPLTLLDVIFSQSVFESMTYFTSGTNHLDDQDTISLGPSKEKVVFSKKREKLEFISPLKPLTLTDIKKSIINMKVVFEKSSNEAYSLLVIRNDGTGVEVKQGCFLNETPTEMETNWLALPRHLQPKRVETYYLDSFGRLQSIYTKVLKNNDYCECDRSNVGYQYDSLGRVKRIDFNHDYARYYFHITYNCAGDVHVTVSTKPCN